MTSFRTFLFAALAPLAIAGCSQGKPVTMADSFDLDIFGPHVDDLHSPYVSGAEFQITVSSDTTQSQAGWTLSSSDPNVMTVTSPLSGGTASVAAQQPGAAILSVKDASGNVVDTHAVVVGVPDQVSLYAEGPLLTGASDADAQVTKASILEGGQATFLVRYFQQGVELYGSGALKVTGTKDFAATTVSQSSASARDFLQVTPAIVAATGSISLVVDQNVVGELPVTSVAPKAVTSVTILPQSTENAQKGDSLSLYAHAIDKDSSEVYGTSFDWLINGTSQASAFNDGPTDLFFYNYDSSVTENVTASYDSFSPYAIIHGSGGSVGSTGNLGCSMTGAPGASGASSLLGLAFALGGIAVVRRRRGSSRPA